MTEWNDSFIHWSLFWTRRLPEGVMVIHQLPPYSEVVQFGDGHGNMMSPFFFGSYGAWGFPLHSYYLMAMWHVSWPRVMPGLVKGFLVPLKLFSFPMFFEALPF